MRALLTLAFVLSSLAAPAALAQPSFDCGKAKNPDEKEICADDRLAELDQAVNIAWQQARRAGGKSRALATARDGQAARRACRGDRVCILDRQVELIGRFRALGAAVGVPPWAESYRAELAEGGSEPAGLPQRIGECARTVISGIADRFGDDINAASAMGSAVQFANGGYQVSYEKVAALANARIGDEVLMCLVSIPQDCPPGDDRGRFYTTTNLRTAESWTLPDSQHMCGGA